MATPAKRKLGGTDGADATSGSDAAARAVESKRVTPPKAARSASSRYTAPNPQHKKGPSPRWVPVLMFALLGIGLLMIILNYMTVLPGSGDAGNGWYLVGGLGSILAGIMVATQYR